MGKFFIKDAKKDVNKISFLIEVNNVNPDNAESAIKERLYKNGWITFRKLLDLIGVLHSMTSSSKMREVSRKIDKLLKKLKNIDN